LASQAEVWITNSRLRKIKAVINQFEDFDLIELIESMHKKTPSDMTSLEVS